MLAPPDNGPNCTFTYIVWLFGNVDCAKAIYPNWVGASLVAVKRFPECRKGDTVIG